MLLGSYAICKIDKKMIAFQNCWNYKNIRRKPNVILSKIGKYRQKIQDKFWMQALESFLEIAFLYHNRLSLYKTYSYIMKYNANNERA